MSRRKGWVGADEPLPLSRQCMLAGVARSGAYTRLCPASENDEDHLLLREIDAEYIPNQLENASFDNHIARSWNVFRLKNVSNSPQDGCQNSHFQVDWVYTASILR